MVTLAHPDRAALLTALAALITSITPERPLRIGIDGRSAAGKTTLADELATALRAAGREVMRASIDDFHLPGHAGRSRRGEWTPQSYYDEGYDYDAFARFVLRPLGPGGDRRCRPALFDSLHDQLLPEEWRELAPDVVAVVDGVFLQRAEFVQHWDYLIWLDVDAETIVQRARQRDLAWLGANAADEVERRYRERVLPAHALYERLTGAPTRAHAIIDNRNPARPVISRLARP